MAGPRLGTAIRQVHRLFDEGTVAGLSDGQLLFVPTGLDLSKWLGMVRQSGVRGPWEGRNTRDLNYLPGVPGLVATTTPDGRFRLVGVGRERLASLIGSGPGIATSEVFAMTRTGPSIKTADRGRGEPSLIFHAGTFDHVASPTRPIEGIVTDKDTGAPLAGVKIKGMVQDDDSSIPAPGVVATTGPDGQYRLLGLAEAGRYRLFARPSPHRPYIDPSPQESSRFEATGIDPDRPRRGYFFHEGRKLAGSIVFPGKSTVVTLRPWGVVTGRVGLDDGKPATGYSLLGGIGSVERFDPDRGLIPTNRRIELDPDGRFRIERLVPGLSYTVHASSNLPLSGPIFEGVRVEPGEVKDLGGRKITPFRE